MTILNNGCTPVRFVALLFGPSPSSGIADLGGAGDFAGLLPAPALRLANIMAPKALGLLACPAPSHSPPPLPAGAAAPADAVPPDAAAAMPAAPRSSATVAGVTATAGAEAGGAAGVAAACATWGSPEPSAAGHRVDAVSAAALGCGVSCNSACVAPLARAAAGVPLSTGPAAAAGAGGLPAPVAAEDAGGGGSFGLGAGPAPTAEERAALPQAAASVPSPRLAANCCAAVAAPPR